MTGVPYYGAAGTSKTTIVSVFCLSAAPNSHTYSSASSSRDEFMELLAKKTMSQLTFARRRAMIPSLANMSKDKGSMPFWFTTTNDSPGLQIFLLKSITAFTYNSNKLMSHHFHA